MSLTITTPATHTRLTTVQTVKDALGISDSDKDVVIDRLIDVATDVIQDYVGHILCRQTYTEKLVGTDRPTVMLTATPVQSVTSVTIESETITDYTIDDPEAGILYRDNGWDKTAWYAWDAESVMVPGTGEKTITIVYTAGYLLPEDSDRDLPPRYEEACIITIGAWLRRDQRGADVRRKRVGDLEIEYRDRIEDAGVPPEAKALIGRRAV